MRSFAVYTFARAAMFAVAYGLIWLVFGRWLQWDAISALWTAFVAMVVSSLVALATLGQLRARLAEEVAARATRSKAAYDARLRDEQNT